MSLIENRGLSPVVKHERHPVGIKLKVWAKIKNTVEEPHLYTSWQWKYDILSDGDACVFIESKNWSK